MQFARGVTVRAGEISICAPQANRIIYHRNEDYFAMNLDEGFADLFTEAKVLLVSGFNAMQSETLLANRLASMERMMAKLPSDAMVFLEDAGYHEPKFRQMVLGSLAGKDYIFSLNADELQEHLKKELNFLDAFQIREALVALKRLIPEPVIVLHT
ncbi:ADP-dependent glucokinase/phosphofructokinase, partial [Xanthomonas citri pv. citri]